MIILVMGVTGSGKSTVGELLARQLRVPFHDADDYHPPANRAKLSSDIPLDDADRVPWLEILADNMRRWQRDGPAVLACSALKESYRAILRRGADPFVIVFVRGDKQTIARRLRDRSHELIKDYERVLDGQFRDLEEPRDAIVVDNDRPPAELARAIVAELESRGLLPR